MLPTIPHDKALHALYGALVFVLAGGLAALLGWPQLARQVGASAALCAGIAKELADLYANAAARRAGLLPTHEVDPADAAWTLAGAMLVWVGAVATEV